MKHFTIKTYINILLVISVILTAFLTQAGTVQSYNTSGDDPFDTVVLPVQALSLNNIPEIKSKSEKISKISSTINQLIIAKENSMDNAFSLAEMKSIRISGDRIQVQIVSSENNLEYTKAAIVNAGGEITGENNEHTIIQAWVLLDTIEELANEDSIYRIQEPAKLFLLEEPKAGVYTTEGLSVINGTAWHAAGLRGLGVEIAIIDGGFTGYPTLLGSDLPVTVTIKNFVDGEIDSQVNGTTPHGTACAEIIHDMAPEARLYLLKVGTDIDLQEAVNWLIANTEVDIISTSLGWFNLTPGDGTGQFAQLAQTARNHGILWVTAAGNERQDHWGGSYSDPDHDGIHDYSSTQNMNYYGPGNGNGYLIPSGIQIMVALRWDDWTLVNQDFDLGIWRWNGSDWDLAEFSADTQNGSPGQTPTEFALATTYGSDAIYGFSIECYSCTRNVNFEVFAPNVAELDKVLNARSLVNLADAPTAMTVAALNVISPYVQEPYSSQGPTNGPGGTANGGFIKPDISGFANVSTVSYSTVNKFNGTSSATPHVAGAAAMVLTAYPGYTPAQVQTFLQSRAVDMGTGGFDSTYGYGRLNLGAPPIPLTVTTITPNLVLNNSVVHLLISGSGFAPGTTVKLTRAGQPDITATNIILTNTTFMSADVNVTGVALGNWNLVITHPDTRTVQLVNAFVVTDRIFKIYNPMLLK